MGIIMILKILLAKQETYLGDSACPLTKTKLNKGEFYEVDLVGCVVEDLKGKNIGVVSAIHNFGAGPLVEIGDELIRFDGYNFPSVNTGKKRIIRKI